MARPEIIKFNEIRIVRIDPTLFELVKKLAKENKRTLGGQAEIMLKELVKIKKLESWELAESADGVDKTLVWCCEGEHDYRTRKEDRVPFIENYELSLTEVTETSVDPQILIKGGSNE